MMIDFSSGISGRWRHFSKGPYMLTLWYIDTVYDTSKMKRCWRRIDNGATNCETGTNCIQWGSDSIKGESRGREGGRENAGKVRQLLPVAQLKCNCEESGSGAGNVILVDAGRQPRWWLPANSWHSPLRGVRRTVWHCHLHHQLCRIGMAMTDVRTVMAASTHHIALQCHHQSQPASNSAATE